MFKNGDKIRIINPYETSMKVCGGNIGCTFGRCEEVGVIAWDERSNYGEYLVKFPKSFSGCYFLESDMISSDSSDNRRHF